MSSHDREITFAEPLLTAPYAELSRQAARIREEAVAVAHNVLQEPALLVLGHRIRPAGEVVVDLGLDRRFHVSDICPADCLS
jgi:hypothetical protein